MEEQKISIKKPEIKESVIVKRINGPHGYLEEGEISKVVGRVKNDRALLEIDSHNGWQHDVDNLEIVK